MERIRVFYFVNLGVVLSRLMFLRPGIRMQEAKMVLLEAETELTGLIEQTLVPLKTSAIFAGFLRDAIHNVASKEAEDEFTQADFYAINNTLSQFSSTLNGDTSIADTYVLSPKGGFDTTTLATNGRALFHNELAGKVPEAITDVEAAARCIAFDLPTAAGFHLHRANESVLHRYYDAVSEGRPRPSGRNIGDYLREMDKHNAGDQKVKTALRDLKDLHRNPLIHPDQSLDTVDEAIDLLGSIRSLVGVMLRAIP